MVKELSELTLEELWQLFPIVLEGYNEEYPSWYAEAKEGLIECLGCEKIERISHIGSTAVVGLISKPTIDILLEIDASVDIETIKSILENKGWLLMNGKDQPYLNYVFNKGYTKYGFADKVFHLHVRNLDDWDVLYFRDYLRAHEDVAIAYSQLKMILLEKYKNDRDGYTEAKTEFIKKYTALAKGHLK